jgi:hypothetical protein
MKKHLPTTMSQEGKKMGAEKSPVFIFLPPSFCLSGPDRDAADCAQLHLIEPKNENKKFPVPASNLPSRRIASGVRRTVPKWPPR